MQNKYFVLLVKVIGKDATLKLCQALGGENIYIPMLDGLVYKNARNNKIYREYKQGARVKDLAKKYGLAPVTISVIVADKKKEYGDDLATKVKVSEEGAELKNP